MYSSSRMPRQISERHSDAILGGVRTMVSALDNGHHISPAQVDKPTMRSRVLLVDRHTLFLEAIEALLKPEYDVTHVTLDDVEDMLRRGAKIQPDILVLNPMIGGFNHVELVRQVRDAMPSTRVLFLTETASLSLAAAAFANGVSGFLVKNSSMEDLMAALHALEHEKLFLDPKMAGGDVDAALQFQSPIARLTPREFEVLGLLLRGWSMKQVARELNVTPRTIAFHKYRAMQTLDVQNNAQLIEAAAKLGLLIAE